MRLGSQPRHPRAARTTASPNGVLVYGNCGAGHADDVETTVPRHTTNGWKDSGAPFILSGYTHTVFAVATESWGNHELAVSPPYDGLTALRAGGNSTFLCHTSTCGQ